MPFKDHGMIGGPHSGPAPTQVICEPVQVPASGIMTCRRGQGQRTFQGQKPPTCDGRVEPKVIHQRNVLACDKCGLVHAGDSKDGVLYYGAVL